MLHKSQGWAFKAASSSSIGELIAWFWTKKEDNHKAGIQRTAALSNLR